jgi:NurA-like 5'-3' nuclease
MIWWLELEAIKAQLKDSDESRRKETERLYEEFGKKYGRAYEKNVDEPETQF